jgi:hypothetical protein
VADHKVIRTQDLFYSPQEAQRGQENDDDRNKKENKFGQEANEGSSVGGFHNWGQKPASIYTLEETGRGGSYRTRRVLLGMYLIPILFLRLLRLAATKAGAQQKLRRNE